jgi:osmotically-inducible protein OsmY
MKKTILTLVSALSLVSMLGCSNWNRNTPASMDNTAIEAEVRKNLAGDKITGMSIDVSGSTVTLSGHSNAMNHDTAIADARKVNGVTNVVDRITVDQP